MVWAPSGNGRAAILWFRQIWMSQTPPPPLKVSKGHMGNIQYTHMAGWLDVTDPPPTTTTEGLQNHLGQIQCAYIWHSIWSDMERRDKGGGLRTAVRYLSTASSYPCIGALTQKTHPIFPLVLPFKSYKINSKWLLYKKSVQNDPWKDHSNFGGCFGVLIGASCEVRKDARCHNSVPRLLGLDVDKRPCFSVICRCGRCTDRSSYYRSQNTCSRCMLGL